MLDLRSRDDGSSRSSIYRKRSYRKDVINKQLWRRAAHRLDPLSAYRLRRIQVRDPRQMIRFLRFVRKATRIMSLVYMPLARGLRLTTGMRKFLRMIILRKRQFFLLHERFLARLRAESLMKNNATKSLQELGISPIYGGDGGVHNALTGYRARINAERQKTQEIREVSWRKRLGGYRKEIMQAQERGFSWHSMATSNN